MGPRNETIRAPVAPGEILAGKYRVEAVLGAGGMGVVVRATHLDLRSRVAVKFMQRGVAENAESVARFLREARATVRLRSDHVARVMDVGRLESGEPYMVMEYLDGVDLSAILHQVGRFPIQRAVDWILQASEGVSEAHAVGIVHRDLKPPNLFVSWHPDGSAQIKVLDFGISKRIKRVDNGDTSSITSSFSILGSPGYMSPEQLRCSKAVDYRTDIWSLGVILYEMLAGRPPFEGTSLPGLILAISNDAPKSIRSFRSDVPKEMEETLFRALAKAPNDRMGDLAELALALAPFGSDECVGMARRIVRVLRAAGLTTKRSTIPQPRNDTADLPSLFDDDTESHREAPSAAEASAPYTELERADTLLHVPPSPTPVRFKRRAGILIAGVTTVAFGGAMSLSWATRSKPVAALAPHSRARMHDTGSVLTAPSASPSINGAASTSEDEVKPAKSFSPPRPRSSNTDRTPQNGVVNILCVPACSQVRVGRIELGPSPIAEAVVPVGRHDLVATLPTGESQSHVVDIKEGQTLSRRIVFEQSSVGVPSGWCASGACPWDMHDNPYAKPDTSGTSPPEKKTDGGLEAYLPENPF